ncbi:VOC family protein [Kovacikia minuta CCNUW1]|uniref:VOC family protein n=1 Tax=Kovacikia minuta TaxID=2931930 RepID=UPI001CCEB37D|nr:VOC family protein [Kovacikia minuta]UBF27505.1 VOC family protein [Kovacikia minuta CCNUW1]
MVNEVKPIPDGYHSVTPSLAIKGAASAIEFYKQAFGATEIMRLAETDGTIGHAELQVGDSRIMLADENPDYNASPQSLGGSSVIIALYVEDVDKVIDQAVAAGAKVVFPVQDQFYGDRSGRIVDPFGHVWIISTHKEDVSVEEMQKRFDALLASK